MIVIGTAGHIDHGKSAIVKRLTGTDPDRLPEEKERGMTIELGFAFMKSSSGDEIAFIDVPGHERFVKNMIAGAGGIDSVMFVVAADDGWMPQSEEHFQIIRLLGLKHGLIVINKIDLVDSEWLELLESDIRQKVKGSFLEDAPILKIAAITGEGFDRLTAQLDKVVSEIGSRREIGKARLYIDRAFVGRGIGRVVAGTLRGGKFELGQTVSVWPAEVRGRIRTLQSNNADVMTASAGQRTAISLTGVEKELLRRGNVIIDSDHLEFHKSHPVLAISVELLSNSPISLTDRRELTVIIGTSESVGEVRLLDQKVIRPGQNGIIFFRPENPIYSLVGDHHIIRLPTPMVTLGGGLVLDHLERLPRKREAESLAYLKDRVTANLEKLIVSELNKMIVASQENFLLQADFSSEEIKTASNSLVNSGEIGKNGSILIHPARFNSAVTHLKAAIEKHLSDKPHLSGLDTDQLRRLIGLHPKTTDALLSYLVAQGELVKSGERYDLAGRGMSLKGEVKKAHDRIHEILNSKRFAPPRLSELADRGKEFRDAIRYMIASGEGYKCGSEFLFLKADWNEIITMVRERINARNNLTVADLKQAFGFSRKYAIPILEETDRIGITRREGDTRTKGKNFENTHPDL